MADNLTSKTDRIKALVEQLNFASRKYYQEDTEIMSNLEYDALYDELCKLEQETGIVLSNSPTVKVGYEILSELPKENHEYSMLSLDKTKEVEDLVSFMSGHPGVLSWKLDGLTVVLTYDDGKLLKAVTRGNGIQGEVITNNAKVFVNVPHKISYKGHLVVRGEAVIKYSDFNRINDKIPDFDAKYKNPRNLCSGSVRQLNNKITAERNVNFFAFNMVSAENVDFEDSFYNQMSWLSELGFDVVEHYLVTPEQIASKVKYFSEKISDNDFPSDGLVLVLDELEYGKSLGHTAKFPRDSIAFKWADEQAVTRLKYIEWSPSRTGLINPVAIFEPVELEGTTVSRASVHNVSILKSLALGEGDEITVYKANMIIPQIADNLTRSGNVSIPDTCPACGGETEIKMENGGVETLYCVNNFCPAKKLKSFSHYVSRNAMNIDGMSDATIEKFIDQGFLDKLEDIYSLDRYKDEIISLEGFGETSYNNLIRAIEASRNTTMARFINALGIPNIGDANAKLICRYFDNNLELIRNASEEELVQIEGIGTVIARGIEKYFKNQENCATIDKIAGFLDFEEEENKNEQNLSGLVFVITGSLNTFANRDELKNLIESRGGKVTGSVSAKTSYLINNDIASGSSKNKKAKSLNIPIITEEEFKQML